MIFQSFKDQDLVFYHLGISRRSEIDTPLYVTHPIKEHSYFVDSYKDLRKIEFRLFNRICSDAFKFYKEST